MNQFTGQLQQLINKAKKGSAHDVIDIMAYLTNDATFAITRYVDFALSLVENPEGVEQIVFYLFHGSLIQRNYASLFLNRIGEWQCVKQAYKQGLIDEIQAFAR